MKKYTSLDWLLEIEDNDNIILGYKIKDDKILIDFSNKLESHHIPYSFENEKKVLEQMKKQISEPSYQKRISHINNYVVEKYTSLSDYLLPLIKIAIELILIDLTNPTIFNVILLILAGANAGIFIAKIGILIEFDKILKDIDKNTLFLENEDEINEYLKENPDIIDELPKKAKELIISPYNKEQNININILDKIKYKQLKKILEKMKIDEKFGFESIEENNELTLLMKKYDESNAN